MGITLKSKNLTVDMGYGGFKRFRDKVASLSGEVFGKHYELLHEGTYLFDKERESFFEDYDKETRKLIEQNEITPEIANFCYQSDCEGKIDRKQAKQIYEKIKDYENSM